MRRTHLQTLERAANGSRLLCSLLAWCFATTGFIRRLLSKNQNLWQVNRIMGIHPSIHPSILHSPDLPLPTYFQLFWGDPETFPGQPRDMVPPASPGSSWRPSTGGTCPKRLAREASERQEQRLRSELVLDGRASQPLREDPGIPAHHLQEFGLWSDLSQRRKSQFTGRSLLLPSDGHELWVVTERTRPRGRPAFDSCWRRLQKSGLVSGENQLYQPHFSVENKFEKNMLKVISMATRSNSLNVR